MEITTPFLWEGLRKPHTDFPGDEASWLECVTGGMSSDWEEWGIELYLSNPIQSLR